MARPRKHEDEAAKARAYRASRMTVDREAVIELLAAVEAGAAAGDPMARAVQTGDVDALLRNLARAFRERTGTG